MTMKEYNRKPFFQRLYAGLISKALVVVIAMAMHTDVCADTGLPEGVPEDAVWLTEGDSGSHNSLDTNSSNHHWSDCKPITKGDTGKVYYVPAGMMARTSTITTDYTIVPIIYSSGSIYSRVKDSKTAFFNDLRLLDGGYVDFIQVGVIGGNVTILATDPDNPASLLYNRNDVRAFSFNATLLGEEDSQLLYRVGSDQFKGYLTLRASSDWTGFKGTLRVADGLSITSYNKAPITSPCTVKFGKDGSLLMAYDTASYSFGNLSFIQDGVVSNKAALTVSGTFDTGTNCTWYSYGNGGAFGTLILGDGLTLIDGQSTPTTVLTVTNKLVVGKNICVEYPNMGASPNGGRKHLLIKLSKEAAADEDLDLSGVSVTFKQAWAYRLGYLKAEADPDNEGGLLIYAVHNPTVYYNGPDEWDNSDKRGNWLSDARPTEWGDGLYPDGEKVYYTTNRVYFESGKPTTFPGKVLMCGEDLCLNVSAYVTNLFLYDDGRIYARDNGVRLGGNLTPLKNSAIRQLGNDSFYLDSALHGKFSINLVSYYPEQNNGGVTFYITADNSDWTGRLTTLWTERSGSECPVGEEHHVRVVVADAKSLGGNPKEFTYNSVELNNFAEIRFTDTSVQTAANRGFGVSNGILNVDDGKFVDLTAPVTLQGELRKFGVGMLGFGGGIRYNKDNDLTVEPEQGKNVLFVKEGGIKASSLTGLNVTFSANTSIVSGGEAMDLTGATVTAEGTIYLTADGNTLEEPAQAVTYPVVKVSATQAATLGAKFKAKKSPWSGWPVTVVSNADKDGNVTYSVKYEKKGFVMSIR